MQKRDLYFDPDAERIDARSKEDVIIGVDTLELYLRDLEDAGTAPRYSDSFLWFGASATALVPGVQYAVTDQSHWAVGVIVAAGLFFLLGVRAAVEAWRYREIRDVDVGSVLEGIQFRGERTAARKKPQTILDAILESFRKREPESN